MIVKNALSGASLAVLICASSSASASTFDIVIDFLGAGETVNYDGGPSETTEAFTQDQKDAFEAAAQFWEGIITGYAGTYQPTEFRIAAALAPEDGQFGSLAYAGPSGFQDQDGLTYSTGGYMAFDADDWLGQTATDPGSGSGEPFSEFVGSARHEMAHALGFGTLWGPSENAFVIPGSAEYTGANALAAYQAEFDSTATFVPTSVEEGHWSECLFNTDPNCDGSGSGFNDTELMTPFAVANDTLSDTTVAAFRDLGFTTRPILTDPTVSAVPLPAAAWMLMAGLGGLGLLRRFGDRRA